MPEAAQHEEAPAPPVPKAVADLVARFGAQFQAYKSGLCNETQLRCELLDPLFKALGWDVNSEQGCAEPCKDVIHGGSTIT
jgi:hypothetical protein